MTKKQIRRRSTRRKPPGHTLPAVYAAAAKALAACVHVSDAKEIRDQADAMVVYAKSAKDSTLIVEATKAKFQAETRCGELLLTMEKNRGAIAGKTGRKGRPVLDQTPTLESLGISKTQSKRWQDLAKRKDAVPDFWQKQLDRLCRIAAAVTEGDRATLDALNAEKHANAKLKRDVNERLLADGIRQLPGKKHGVILSDPGLKFVTWSEKGMTRTNPANHYGVSDLDAILKLDIDRIAAPDCVLFHWATSPRLEDALTIMTTWRFSNPSHIVWLKDRTGTGYWVRNRHEILLIGTRRQRARSCSRHTTGVGDRGTGRTAQRQARNISPDHRADVSAPAQDRTFQTRTSAARLVCVGSGSDQHRRRREENKRNCGPSLKAQAAERSLHARRETHLGSAGKVWHGAFDMSSTCQPVSRDTVREVSQT
jgi:MT-A70